MFMRFGYKQEGQIQPNRTGGMDSTIGLGPGQ